MKITWRNIIDIIEQMFGESQSAIAKQLDVDRSTISKLKSGKQLSLNRPRNQIYQVIFNPEEKNSFAYGQYVEYWLGSLKDAIKELNLVAATKDLRNDDYKEFVLELLRQANKNEPDSSAVINDSLVEETKTEEKSQEIDTIPDYVQDNVSITKEESSIDVVKTLQEDCHKDFNVEQQYSVEENEPDSSAVINDSLVEETKTEEKSQEIDTIPDYVQDGISIENEGNVIQKNMQDEIDCAQLAIPQSCKICLCCDNWKGNVRNAYKSPRGVEGQCIMYDKDTLSIDGKNCKRFYPNYGRVTLYDQLRKGFW